MYWDEHKQGVGNQSFGKARLIMLRPLSSFARVAPPHQCFNKNETWDVDL